MLALLALAIVAFVATNVDDLFLLLVLFGRRGRSATSIALGQYIGFGAIVIASVLVSMGALVVPRAWVGMFGVFPFALGVRGLLALRHGREEHHDRAPLGMGTLRIAAITIASGGDNIAVYAPLFARRPAGEIASMVAVFGVMVGAFCALAFVLVKVPVLAGTLERWGHVLAPVVLVGLGIWVFVDAETFPLLVALVVHHGH